MSVSNLKAAVTGKPSLLPTHTEPAPSTPPHSLLKAALIGGSALLSAAGIYCASKMLGSSGVEHALTAEKVDKVGLDISHIGIQTRGLPTVIPVPNQQANPGSLYQSVAHTFFTSPELVGYTVTQSPKWLKLKPDPQQISIYNADRYSTGVQVVGSIAYIIGSLGLQIINITNPTSPTALGIYTVNYITAVQIAGSHAFLAAETNGLLIIDISNPRVPALLGSYHTSGAAMAVQVLGNTAYVAADTSGLQIIDITNPRAPALLGSYDTPGQAEGVQVLGNTAYVADGTSGLQIIDVSNPRAPVLLGSYHAQGYDASASAVQIYKTSVGGTIYAYVAENVGGLQILYCNNPKAITLVGNYSTPGGSIYAVQAVQSFQSAQSSGWLPPVYILNGVVLQYLSLVYGSVFQPMLIWSYQDLYHPQGFQIIGSTAYVTDLNGFHILDLNAISFYGTPRTTDQGDFTVILNGTTSQGTAPISFKLRVGHPPSIILAISQVLAKLSQPLNYTFDPSIFFDQDDQPQLIYSVTPLPAWLKFNPSTRLLSGTPGISDIATLSLYYSANDTYFLPSRIPFSLKVEAPPVLNTPLPDITQFRNTLFNLYIPVNTFTDPNMDDILTYSAGSLPAWLKLSSNGFFTGTPPTLGKFNITIFANDGFGGSAADSFGLLITDPLQSLPVVAGGKATYQVPDTAFANVGTITNYAGTMAGGSPLPSWIQFDATTRIFTATPQVGLTSTLQLQVSATNTLGEVFDQVFAMNIAPNFSPVYKNPISAQQASVGVDFNYAMPDNVFEDPNGDQFNRLTYEATGLPSWLKFDKTRRVFSGKPTRADTNTFAVRTETIAVIANNGQTTATGTFNIAVSGESYGALAIKIIAPLVSTPATLWGFYKKRALLLNQIHKKKYTKAKITVMSGAEFHYQFSCNPEKIQDVTVSKISKIGLTTKIYSKVDGSRFFCRKEVKNWVVLPNHLPHWLSYDENSAQLYAEKAGSASSIGTMRIEAVDDAGIILEQFDLEVVNHALEPALQAEHHLDHSAWSDATDTIPLTTMGEHSLPMIDEMGLAEGVASELVLVE